MKPLNVLSLFDGISCAQIALERAGFKVANYFAAEIEKASIKITQHNYPNTIQLGDVTKIKASDLPQIDLLVGGSPCQGFSTSGKQLNFDDPRSKLFFEYVRLLKECRPGYFLLENVRMKSEYQDVISKQLGVQPVLINSQLVSAQSRNRLYWSSIDIDEPDDNQVTVRDILDQTGPYKFQTDFQTSYRKYAKNIIVFDYLNPPRQQQGRLASYLDKKHLCLVGSHQQFILTANGRIRKTTILEQERLQTVPDGYTKVERISDTTRHIALGNGFTVDVIAHIFNCIRGNKNTALAADAAQLKSSDFDDLII